MEGVARTSLPPPQFRTRRNFFGWINMAFISLQCYFSLEDDRTPTSSHHPVLAFIVPVLLGFLQVKYQGKNISPFDTNPKTMCVAIASLLLYCFAYDAELRFSSSPSHSTPSYTLIAGRGMALFGSLSLVSLASILFPDSLEPVLFSLYIMFSAVVLLRCELQMLWNWLQQHAPERQAGRTRAFTNTRAMLPV